MSDQLESDTSVERTGAYAVAFAILFPTLLTYVYFVYLANHPTGIQQLVYGAGKTLQFAFPLVWVYAYQRSRLTWAGPSRRGLMEGGLLGVVMSGAILVLYSLVLQPNGYLEGTGEAVQEKLRDTGLDTLPKFIGAAVFYSLVHSLLEEYYWRWFVFGELRQMLRPTAAVAISSLGFMAHHVIVLGTFLGWQSPLTYLASLSIAAGGAVWAWLYHRSGSLYGAWLSHLLVDAVIFLIGYDLAHTML